VKQPNLQQWLSITTRDCNTAEGR